MHSDFPVISQNRDCLGVKYDRDGGEGKDFRPEPVCCGHKDMGVVQTEIN